jgi:hypothetical protein
MVVSRMLLVDVVLQEKAGNLVKQHSVGVSLTKMVEV